MKKMHLNRQNLDIEVSLVSHNLGIRHLFYHRVDLLVDVESYDDHSERTILYILVN